MKNNLAQLLSNAKAKGVNEGLTAMELCTLVALGNIIDEYLPEDKIPEFLKHTESKEFRPRRASIPSFVRTNIRP